MGQHHSEETKKKISESNIGKEISLETRKNPFDFKHIKRVKTEKEIVDINNDKPCVVFASPGMLQSGLSKNLFIN